MKRLNTQEDLILYIKEELGYPLLQVELTDNQICHCIDKSIQMFTNVAYDGELTKYIKFDCKGKGSYMIDPTIEEILSVSQNSIFANMDLGNLIDQNLSNYILSSSGIALSYLVTMSANRAMIDKYYSKSIYFEYNSHKSTLTIFENFYGPLLVEAKCRYIPDKYDKIFDQEWVKAMSTAQARLLQSTVTGKYSQSLVNGAQINYSDMRSLAQEEIQNLKDELMNKWTEPSIFLIG